MTDNVTYKVLVKRPRRVGLNGREYAAGADPGESGELELVSTQMLKRILTSRDDSDRNAVAVAANTAAEGVLARDPRNGRYEIIADDDLRAILDSNQGLPKLTRPADATVAPLRDYADNDHLALVSTKALRKVLDHDDDA